MEKLTIDSNLTESFDSEYENIYSPSSLNSTLKKCNSLISLQRLMILRADPETNPAKVIRLKDITSKNVIDIDITKKQNPEVINQRLKKFFNMNNYEKNIKSQAWKKDLNHIYLGLNDEKDNKDSQFFEYNFEKRNKKKEGLMFLRNFFGQLKMVKKDKYKKRDKSKEKIINLNKYEKYYFHNRKNDPKKVNEEDLNILLNKLKIKYSPQKLKEEKLNKMENKFLTEINNNSFNFNNKFKSKDFRKQNLFNSKYHLNQMSKKFNTANNEESIRNNNRYLFPKIKSTFEIEKNKATMTMTEHKINNNELKYIKTNASDRTIFNKNKIKLNKGINKKKIYLENLKNIYKNKEKNKYRTINNESINNFEMPKLLIYKEKPLFKKNNQLFFSPLHYSKYEQMREIKDKLIGVTGLLDKEVFAVYNKNI